jgi:hypothetical protein
MRKLSSDCAITSNIPVIYRVSKASLAAREAIYQEVDPSHSERDAPGPALLFIHGLEYHHPSEVLRDLVFPFMQSTPNITAETQIFFLYWPSCISPRVSEPVNCSATSQFRFSRKLLDTTRRGWRFGLERRMRTAAGHVSNWLSELSRSGQLPTITIVSHSLGARVWSHAVDRLLKTADFDHIAPGPWISLQPALDADAFSDQGEFASVADYYLRHMRPISVVHSRYDMVLHSAYRLATGRTAMGLVGARGRCAVESFDVSQSVGEAHGNFCLRKRAGCFFKRSGLILQRLIANSALHGVA